MKVPTIADLRYKGCQTVDTTGEELVTVAQEVLGAVVKERRGKPKPKPCIIVDSREQAPLRFSDEVTTEVVGLQTGDYSLRGATELVAIERKALPDLAQCCGRDRERYWEQMTRLAEYRHKFLVIEGLEERIWAKAYMSEISPKAVLATLRAVQVDFGVCVIHAENARDAAARVEWILTRIAKRKEAGRYVEQPP